MGLERRSSESWVSDDLFVFVRFVGEAHATVGFRRFWVVGVGWDNRIRRDICLPSFPRRQESTFEFWQLFLNICFLGFRWIPACAGMTAAGGNYGLDW